MSEKRNIIQHIRKHGALPPERPIVGIACDVYIRSLLCFWLLAQKETFTMRAGKPCLAHTIGQPDWGEAPFHKVQIDIKR